MLHSELNEKYLKGAEIIRLPIEAIILTLSDNDLQFDIRGDLVGNSDDCVLNAKAAFPPEIKPYSKLYFPLA